MVTKTVYATKPEPLFDTPAWYARNLVSDIRGDGYVVYYEGNTIHVTFGGGVDEALVLANSSYGKMAWVFKQLDNRVVTASLEVTGPIC